MVLYTAFILICLGNGFFVLYVIEIDRVGSILLILMFASWKFLKTKCLLFLNSLNAYIISVSHCPSLKYTFQPWSPALQGAILPHIHSINPFYLYCIILKSLNLSSLNNNFHPSQDALPLLAKEYGFEYELVQYKWPRWLHQQSEKQRIIWGYKILFLDVLFPLDIKKIIFVDADQVSNITFRQCVFTNKYGLVSVL